MAEHVCVELAGNLVILAPGPRRTGSVVRVLEDVQREVA